MLIGNFLVLEDDFIVYLSDLMKRDMTVKQCLEMSQSVSAIMEQKRVLERAKLAFAEQYGKKENGQIVLKDQILQFDDDTKRDLFMAKFKEMLEATFEIPLSSKIKVYEDEISTPQKIFLLQSIIDICPRL